MLLYRALIRSRLDDGYIILASASSTNLNFLSTIANDAMRVASGVFRSTPIESLNVLVNELPLPLWRDKLSLQ